MAPVIPLIGFMFLLHGINGRSLDGYSVTHTPGYEFENEPSGLQGESNISTTPSDMNMTFIFQSSDTVGHWRWNWFQRTADDPIKKPIDDRTMAAHLDGNKDCYVVTKFITEMWNIVEQIKIGRLYKKSMVPVLLKVTVIDEKTGILRHVTINSTYILREADQSDFKFLPWKMEHFDTIGKLTVHFR